MVDIEKEVYFRILAGDYNSKMPYPIQAGPESHDARAAYRADAHRLEREVFRADLAEQFGLTGHPKEPKLFEIAWRNGHSSGLNEVLSYYEDMSELLK